MIGHLVFNKPLSASQAPIERLKPQTRFHVINLLKCAYEYNALRRIAQKYYDKTTETT